MTSDWPGQVTAPQIIASRRPTGYRRHSVTVVRDRAPGRASLSPVRRVPVRTATVTLLPPGWPPPPGAGGPGGAASPLRHHALLLQVA